MIFSTTSNVPRHSAPSLGSAPFPAGASSGDGAQLAPRRMSVKSLVDVVMVRQQGLDMARALGFPSPEAVQVAVVISELARNILLYAQEGVILLTPYTNAKKGIQVIAEDKGPGIPDIQRVLAGGYTTSGGMGMGVSGSKRLVDEFQIESTVGVGTKVTATKWVDD
jgi:serine/threonine-protein kinase RsbT